MNLPQTASAEMPKPQNNTGKEYCRILKENLSLDEKLYAIYSRAMQDLEYFRVKRLPPCPDGFINAYEEYKASRDDEKKEAWKTLTTVYFGYFKNKDSVESENASNKSFLIMMRDFFIGKGVEAYTSRIEDLLTEYEASHTIYA